MWAILPILSSVILSFEAKACKTLQLCWLLISSSKEHLRQTMKMSPFFKAEVFSRGFCSCLCIRATAITFFFNCRENLLPSFMSLAFLSFPSVGVKTSSHLSYVISSYTTELVIPLLDDHSHGLWARTIPALCIGSCPPEISAPELSIVLRKSQNHEGAWHGEWFSPDS